MPEKGKMKVKWNLLYLLLTDLKCNGLFKVLIITMC